MNATVQTLSRRDTAVCPSADRPVQCAAGRADIVPVQSYALGPTLRCGQTFRFHFRRGAFEGACGDLALVASEDDGILHISCPASCGGIRRAAAFLDAAHAVAEEAAESCAYLVDRYPSRGALIKAVFEYSDGVHILRQPIVETLVGYLLSVQSSVDLVGRRLEAIARLFPSNARIIDGRRLNLFPTVAQLRTLPRDAVSALRLGYRTPWVLELLARMPDERGLEELRSATSAERQLYFRSYAGIGPKVAACIELFAYGGEDAFPIDTWVDRGLRRVLGFTSAQARSARDRASATLGPHCGLFGEYLFRFERDHAPGS